jgi:hypothetical protein
MRNTFHASLLTPYTKNKIYRPAYARPPADIVEGEPEWEVNQILKHKRGKGGTEYHVLWKGYGIDEVSWQSEEDLEHAQEALEDYRRRHKINPELTPGTSRMRNRRAWTTPIPLTVMPSKETLTKPPDSTKLPSAAYTKRFDMKSPNLELKPYRNVIVNKK